MRFAVLGTGQVGQTLAAGLHGKGHDIIIGTRDPSTGRMDAWLEEHPGIDLATFEEAAERCEAAVLCTNWAGTENALQSAGPDHLSEKLVIDVTNPLGPGPGGAPGLITPPAGSAGAQVQAWLPRARVVKCWNLIGNPYMIDPTRPDGGLPEAPTMFIAGDDRQAKEDVRELLGECGWDDVVDIGGIEASGYLEGLAMVWIRTYGATGSGAHGFRMVRG